jgi:predicted HTH domain antitoxin
MQAQDLVKAGLYDNEDEVNRDGLRHLLRARPDLRVKVAIHRYQTEEMSLAKAASLAGVSWEAMREMLLEQGIQPRLGPESVEEVAEEVQVLRDHFGFDA